MFDYILLTFYNSIQHNGDVSPKSNTVLITNITVDLSGKFIIFIFVVVVVVVVDVLCF